MKKPTRGPQATRDIFGEVKNELDDLAAEDESIWEEIERLKKRKKELIVLEDGKLKEFEFLTRLVRVLPE